MKKKNGFTLIELLAVIVILGIILVIATTNVLKSIKNSRAKAKYIAAKEIVDAAEAYIAATNQCRNETGEIVECIGLCKEEGHFKICSTDNSQKYVTIDDIKEYLEADATNPETGENDLLTSGKSQVVCKNKNYSSDEQKGYDVTDDGYYFDGYFYGLNGSCK